jgi:hypothetical protein
VVIDNDLLVTGLFLSISSILATSLGDNSIRGMAVATAAHRQALRVNMMPISEYENWIMNDQAVGD